MVKIIFPAELNRLAEIDRETTASRNRLEAKINGLKRAQGVLPQGEKLLHLLSVAELKALQKRAEVVYYQKREQALQNIQATYIDPLTYQVKKGGLSSEERREQLQQNTAYASREINGKRYYPYEKKDMQKLFQAYAQLKEQYPDYPSFNKVNQQELNATSTGYYTLKGGHNHRHCAGGGEEIDNQVPLVRHRYVNKKKQYVTRYFFLCNRHKWPDLGSANYKNFTFRTAEEAFAVDQVQPVTYGEVEQELQSRTVQSQVQQQLKSSRHPVAVQPTSNTRRRV